MTDNWYSGEYLAARIIITIISTFIAFWIFLICCTSIRLSLKRLYNRCCYKTATVIPIPRATFTIDPINAYAKEVSVHKDVIIL